MKFYFPDSQDQISPDYDFISEEYSPFRVRQRDDRYAHEVLNGRPYDGLLISKTMVDGTTDSPGRYSMSHRNRLYRVGAREFFRLDSVEGEPLEVMGDCGAFSYVKEEEPPYSVDEVIDFYAGCGLDLGLSVDHVILGFQPDDAPPPENWTVRREITLQLAEEFIRRHRSRRCRFQPVAVAQGWSPASIAKSIGDLQAMGFKRIAIGGMVALKTSEILACLRAAAEVRDNAVELHLLGVTRCDEVLRFRSFGVASFDSTSPFRQAFKDDTDNYYALDGTYVALRVPQVDGNTALKRRIRAGQLEQARAFELERACLQALRQFDRGRVSIDEAVGALRAYEELHDPKHNRSLVYRSILMSMPWKDCLCGVCKESGVDVAIFRGTERNKRRGFHNVWVYRQRLEREIRGSA